MSSFVGQFDKYFVGAKEDSIHFDFGPLKSAAFFLSNAKRIQGVNSHVLLSSFTPNGAGGIENYLCKVYGEFWVSSFTLHT